jgi:hypothetical protein
MASGMPREVVSAGALTSEMGCDINLENGATKSRKLLLITGNCGTW